MEESDEDITPHDSKRAKMDSDEKRSKVEKIVKELECDLDSDEKRQVTDAILRALKVAGEDSTDPKMVTTGVTCGVTSHVAEKIQPIPDLVNRVLESLGLTEVEPKPSHSIPLAQFMGRDAATKAFESEYVVHGGETALLEHLKVQRNEYRKSQATCYPFFSIIQSSGYGKSRLVDQLRKTVDVGFRIIYLSFAEISAYPASNVLIDSKVELAGREVAEAGFAQLFSEASASCKAETFTLRKAETIPVENCDDEEEVLFVVDEVSQLLSKFATEDVDFFRCLRRATKDYVDGREKSFFVLLSTFSSVNQLMPGRYFDPSSKTLWRQGNEALESMKPFLLHHAIGLRNSEAEILNKEIAVCHSPETLFSMGRPLWYSLLGSLLETTRSPSSASLNKLLEYARAKLLQRTPAPSVENLTSQQMLALLACRTCLTISPVSRFAPAMVASHMGTAVSISTKRDEIVVAYPSEPILALASRSYFRMHDKGPFLRQMFIQLKEYLASGAVEKGHRGEVIVRLLNLLAIDNCMRKAKEMYVVEVSLGDFLAQFDRKDANLSEQFEKKPERAEKSEKQRKKVLKMLGIMEEEKAEGDEGFPRDLLVNGKVCFTHFVYLSDEVMITPDLIRYAYRRTAAFAVNAGRRGIDWIIPVRIINNDDNEKFVGLAGQDKNRMRDTLAALSSSSNETTHHKVTASYFLSDEEKASFEKTGWSLHWPAIVFAIGSEEVGAALSDQATRMRLRGDGSTAKAQFPCIVLTSLGYDKLMDAAADEALRQLRDFIIDVPSVYKNRVPLTYGMATDHGGINNLAGLEI